MGLNEVHQISDVGRIPNDWKVGKLGDLLSICHGKSQKEVEAADGPYPILATGGQIGTASRPLFSKPSVLIGRKGTINQPQYMDTPFWSVDTLFYSLILGENSAKFLYYKFLNINWLQFNEASGVPSLNARTIEKIQISYPSPTEQLIIAQALSDVDALIAGLEKLIAKKRDLKQAAMQQLLTGQTRLPGFSGEWVEACLGDLARIQRGASPRPIESPVWFDDASSVGWVRISDVTSAGMYLTETQQKLSSLGIQHSRPVESGNLIMSICATVGRPVITEIDVCIHDGFVVFEKLEAEKHFLYYVLKWIEPNWSKQGQTGSQMNLNTPLINRTKIMLPPAEEQQAIAEALSAIDSDLVVLHSRLTKTRELKQGMMQELLTGKTRLI